MKPTYRWTLVITAALTLVSSFAVGTASAVDSPHGGTMTPQMSGHPPMPAHGTAAGGKVVETMDAAGYTYVRLDTGHGEVWAVGPRVDVAVGDEVSLRGGMEMRNYHSKSLDRTFDSVLFVDAIQVGGAGEGAAASAGALANPHENPHAGMSLPGGSAGKEGKLVSNPHGAAVTASAEGIDLSGIEKVEGGQTVADLYSEKAELEGKEVAVRGRVVKVNPAIMGRNWLHVRDGTKGPDGNADLTVTTTGAAKVGDTVVVHGKLALNRDFGFGYRYELVVEDARVDVE